jgi:hypothetical protein
VEEAARVLAQSSDPRGLSRHLIRQLVNMCKHLETDPEPVLEALYAALKKQLES